MVCNWNRSAWNSTFHHFETPLEEWTVACAPFTIVFNALVLYIAFRYVSFRDKLSQCFVVLMTVSDLTHGAVYMATKQYVHCFPRAVCGTYYFIVWLTNMLSMLALVFLNVDKCIYVGMPLRYHSIVTPRVVALEIFAGFALSLGMCFLTYFAAIGYSEKHAERGLTECKIHVKPPLFYAMLTILFYVIPTLVCLAISFYIFGVAQKSMREDAKRATANRRRLVSTSAAASGANQALMPRLSQSAEERAALAAHRRKLFKRIFFVFASTVFTSVTVLPYRIALSLYYLSDNSSAIIDVVYALWFLLPLSAVLNPIITVVTQRQYRNGLRRIFKSCGLMKSPCLRRSPETEHTLETQLEVFRLL